MIPKIKNIKLEKFTGETGGISVSKFQSRFQEAEKSDTVLYGSEWNDTIRYHLITKFLDGKATIWWDRVRPTITDQERTYTRFIQELTEMFKSPYTNEKLGG